MKTMAMALALLVALSACGGGGDAQVADPPAATTLQIQCKVETAPCTVTIPMGRLASTATFNVIASIPLVEATWINHGLREVTVQIDHTVHGKYTAAAGSAGRAWYDFSYVVSADGVPRGNVSPYLANSVLPFASTQAVIVPAGAALTVTLNANAVLTAGERFSNDISDASTRIAIVP